MNTDEYDLVIPMSRRHAEQSAAQRWYYRQSHQPGYIDYIPGDWHIDGAVYIFFQNKESPLRITGAQLRFGNNDSMEGFAPGAYCLYASYADTNGREDDKRYLENIRFDYVSQTISGTAGGHSIVFRVYPFQVSRLKRMDSGKIMRVFVATHRLACAELLKV
jgi:hypothetical protein